MLHGPSELLLLSRCEPYPHHCSLIQPYSRAFAQNVLSLKIPLLPHPSLSPSNLDCWNSNPSTHLFSMPQVPDMSNAVNDC